MLIFPYFALAVPLFLHLVGWYLLYTRSSNISKTQKVFLLHLSMAEIVLCVLYLLSMIVREIYGTGHVVTALALICMYSFVSMYVLIMISLTLDRFFMVYLNIKYALYWSTKRTRRLMSFVWVIAFMALGVSVTYYRNDKCRLERITGVYKFTSPIGDFLFLIVAIATYSYIAMKMLQSENESVARFTTLQPRITRVSIQSNVSVITNINSSQSNGGEQYHVRPKRTRRRPNKLLLPTLLVATYTVFVVIPDVVHFCMDLKFLTENLSVRRICDSMFYIGLASDAIIYVMLATTVGKRILNRIFGGGNS